jgi:hypothetical protein
MCSSHSFRQAKPDVERKPLSAIELMRIKDDLKCVPKEQQKEIIDFLIWGTTCTDPAEEQYRQEWAAKLEKQKILMENIKKAKAKLDEDGWVFEKSANGWI